MKEQFEPTKTRSIAAMPRRRPRFFNTTGPCNLERHFMLPSEERLQGGPQERYIRDELYWLLHAPRQTGKTTFLQSWMREINAKGEAVTCYVTVERRQGLDFARAMPAACEAICGNALKTALSRPNCRKLPLPACSAKR